MKLHFILALISFSCSKRPPFLLNDFESETYGTWQATGSTFGPGPVDKNWPAHPVIKGLRGNRVASSFHDGAIGVGTLTSAQFKIERRYINFLIGGGNSPDSLGVQLSVDEQVVYKSTGAAPTYARKPSSGGQADSLVWRAWDLKDYHGKFAQIVVFDFAAGERGYVIVDHIMQSDVSALKVEPGPHP